MEFTLTLGSAPPEESCAQTLDPDYEIRAKVECQAYIRCLTRAYEAKHGTSLPTSVRLFVKANGHDFGVYYEVSGRCPEEDKEAVEALLWLDSEGPTLWDEEALVELDGRVREA